MSFPGRAAQRAFHLVDANNQTVGRLAAQIVPLLKGKYKPTYRPNSDCGDNVIVINAGGLKFTGNKLRAKVYYRHTGFPGGLMERTAEEQMRRQPEKVLEAAVLGMLRRTTLRHRHIEPKLRIFPDGNIPDKYVKALEEEVGRGEFVRDLEPLEPVSRALNGKFLMTHGVRSQR